jgi:hypothetical protein
VNKNKLSLNNGNENKIQQSLGLDVLTLISQLGCKWHQISEISSNTANILLHNSCNIIQISETKIATKISNKNQFYSPGIIERNQRLITYGISFIRTYESLNIKLEDFFSSTENRVLKSFSVLLHGILNRNIMAYEENAAGLLEEEIRYHTDVWNGGRYFEILNGIIDGDGNENNEINTRNNNKNDEMEIAYENRDFNKNNDINCVKNNQNDNNEFINNDNSNNKEETEIVNKNKYKIEIKKKTEQTEEIDSLQRELTMLENMVSATKDEENSSNIISPEKKQADDDFFLEISSVSKFPKKSKFSASKDKNSKFRNINTESKEENSEGEIVSDNPIVTPSSLDTSPSGEGKVGKGAGERKGKEEHERRSEGEGSDEVIGEGKGEGEGNSQSYSGSGRLVMADLFRALTSSQLKWQKISQKNKIEFSNNLSEFFTKIDELPYFHFVTNYSNEFEKNEIFEKSKNSEENIGQYLERNKKYFFFLRHRINLYLFLKEINFDKKSCTYKLLQNLVKLEKDTEYVSDDLQFILSTHSDTTLKSHVVNQKLCKIVANELNEKNTQYKI